MAEGWHKGEDGMLVKKWDPHRETRKAAYEESLKEHQLKRLNGEGAVAYASNQAGTVGERGAAVHRAHGRSDVAHRGTLRPGREGSGRERTKQTIENIL